METKHVVGLRNRSGDPSPHTTQGVFRAVQAAATQQWGSNALRGKMSPSRLRTCRVLLAQQLH